jgi:hypothetical protein
MAVRIHHADHVALPLALTSSKNGGPSVGIVRSWTQAMECVHVKGKEQ